MPTASTEDYIKTIYKLESSGITATTNRIATDMGVKMASVTGRVKDLAAKGYLKHRPYYGVTLTKKGRSLALKTLRRHRLIELFLVKTLGLSWDQVHGDAEILEHAVSDQLIDRICDYLGSPEFDPHGSPIPRKDGTIQEINGLRLSEFQEGRSGTIVQVADHDDAFLRYLTSIELKVGTRFKLAERVPFGGPLILKVGRRQLSLGAEAAARVMVEPV